MTELSSLPSIRVRLPFQDRREFLERFAPVIGAKGVRIPTSKLRPVGSEIRLVLELRNGEVVSGDAVIEAHVQVGGRPALLARYRRLHEGSIVFPLAPVPRASVPARAPAPARTSASMSAPMPVRTPVVPSTRGPAAVPQPTPGPVAAARTATPPVPRTSTPPALAPAPVRPSDASASAGAEAPARELVAEHVKRAALEPLDPTLETGPSDRAEPSPAPRAEEPAAAAKPWWRRRGVQIAAWAMLLAFTAAGAVGAVRVASRLRRSAAPSAVGSAPSGGGALAAAARVDIEVAAADRSISRGELSGGPDSALAHLVAARGLEAKNARVQTRLRLLAETFERLGTHALARGDSEEAAVHLAAADEADPGRAAVRQGLERLRSSSNARSEERP